MRGLLRDALKSPLPTAKTEWEPYARQVTEVAEALAGRALGANDPFLTFHAAAPVAQRNDENIFQWQDGERQIRVRLGTIASVKGQTHDATLVLETNEHTKMDVAEALNVAFLAGLRPTGKYALKALMNVFVGATRPRYGLCLATKREVVNPVLEDAIRQAGWSVIDLTKGTCQNNRSR